MTRIDAVRAVMPRTQPAAALDDVERLLATGVEVPGSRSPLGHAGVNGKLFRVTLADPGDPARTLDAVLRPGQAQAPQEVFGWGIARALGADYLLPAAAMRDGGAAVQLVKGEQARAAGISSLDSLRAGIARGYASTHPDVDAATQARVDVELAKVVDYLVANSDRHAGNAMYEASSGALHLVDTGNLGITGFTRMRPMFPDFAHGGELRVPLHPHTVAAVRANLTDEVIDGLHARLRADIMAARPGPGARFTRVAKQTAFARVVAKDAYVRDLKARRDALLATGELATRRLNKAEYTAATIARAYPVGTAAAVAGVGALGAGAVARAIRE